MSNLFTKLQTEQAKQKAQVKEVSPTPLEPVIENPPISQVTQPITRVRDRSRDIPRKVYIADTMNLPTRDEIQLLSFKLRDELKVKVQAEVPHEWQKELDEIAKELNVGKLELYRFVFGEFLGKVQRGSRTGE